LKKPLIAVILLLLFSGSIFAADNELQLLARSNIVLEDPGLNVAQWRWVREHKKLRLAVWLPMSPPYDITTGLSDYGGINADFIGIIGTNLNVEIEVLRFSSYDAALAALAKGEADIMAQAGSSQRKAGLILSQPYSKNRPVEVSNMDAPRLKGEQSIAICPQYDRQAVLARYPSARMETFSSSRHALEALAFRHIDLFICDSTTVQYLISQSSLSNLSSRPVPVPFATEGFSFAALPKQKQWIAAIDRVLQALPESVSVEIHRRWNGGIPLSLGEQRPVFTTLEKKWVAEHRHIRVAVIAQNNPLSWFNGSGQMRGIIADILTALRLRTGLIFDIQPYPSFEAALKAVENDKSDIVAGAIQTSIWQHNLLTTRTWLYNSWVMVGKKNPPPGLQPTRIVTQLAQAPADWLERHSDEEIVNVDNWRAGLKRVMDGKSDMMIMPLIVANDWLLADEFASLKILGSVDTAPMRFSFGSSRRLYPLVMILNKALINIPPEDLHAITRNSGNGNELAVMQSNPLLAYKGLWISLLLFLTLLAAAGGWRIAVLRSRLQKMTREKNQAESVSQIKTQYLATMSHEVRTPVSAMIGLLELVMSRPQDTQDNQQRIQVAWQGGQSLLALIGNILDVSRIEADRLVLYPQRTSLLALLESIVVLFEGIAGQKGLAFHVEIDSELDKEVLIDPLRFRQILSNLLSNAIKFTSSGSVTLRAIHHHEESSNMVNVRLEVEDTGQGIDHDVQQRLFQPFSQGQVGQGSGLGLYISRRLAEMMGGKIALLSQPQKGTKVTVSLRLSPLSPLPGNIPKAQHESVQQNVCARVVVVDDNSAGRMLLEHQLLHLGHQPVCFADASEALRYLERHTVDLVITDCNMPGMDGFALAAALQERNPMLPLIGLTADARGSTREAAINAGMTACLFKPVTLEQLAESLKNVAFVHAAAANPLPSITLPSALLAGENGKAFLRLQLDELEEVLHWFRQGDAAERPSRLHRLRGGLQLLGVPAIEALCVRLEEQSEPEEMAELEAALTALHQALNERLQTL